MKWWTKGAVGALLAAGVGCGSMGWAWAQGGSGAAGEAAQAGAPSGLGKTFQDTAGHWAEAVIGAAVGQGYVNGYEDGTFRPEAKVTRAEYVKLVVTALNQPVSGETTGADWYVPYVNAAVNVGIHQWSDFTAGDWNTPMSRYEMARMAARAVGEKTEEDKKWMYLATKAGLIKGTDETGTLDEEGTTTRAQAVTIIGRILEVKAGNTLPADKHAVSRAEVLWHKTNIFTVMPQYFGKLHPSSKWDPEDLFIESDDGLYRAELDQLLAIDLEDPQDPFLGEVPPVETLKWYNKESTKTSPFLSKGMSAYLLVYNGPVVFNKDSNKYGERSGIQLSILGAKIDDYEALAAGTLNGMTQVFKEKVGDKPIAIFPKSMKTKGDLILDLYTPSIPSNKEYRKRILWSITPEKIGG